jgi:hypothetical protein
MAELIDAGDFYAEYHGHQIMHLMQLRQLLLQTGPAGFIYLAGDSSLDNKHWFFTRDKHSEMRRESDFVGKAINGYEQALSPPLMAKDVSYWLNDECAKHAREGKPRYCCINTAIEESTLVQREEHPIGLLAQDEFIRDNITENDILVVDVGGNDIALRPTTGVIVNMGMLVYLTPTLFVRANLAPGLIYFIHMFKFRLENYIKKMVEKKKPRKVIPCMLYFLDETPGGSWADGTLEMLGYNKNPDKLQTIMRKVYSWAVSQISIPGVEVAPLDSKSKTLSGLVRDLRRQNSFRLSAPSGAKCYRRSESSSSYCRKGTCWIVAASISHSVFN